MCRSLCVVLSGDLTAGSDVAGDNNFQALLLMVNADEHPLAFTLPVFEHLGPWQCLLHTQTEPQYLTPTEPLDAQSSPTRYLLQDRSLMLFHADFIRN